MTTRGAVLKEHLRADRVSRLLKAGGRDQLHDLLEKMKRHDMGIMSMADPIYPDALRNISAPPVLMYYIGEPDCLMNRCITMVGSRKASPQGAEATQTVAAGLSENGVTVVSGLAMGVDSAAHTGCTERGGTTVAVLGCGLDINYPVLNERLRKDILDCGGLLLSEYPP